MVNWQKVRWTQARQITALMGLSEKEAPPPQVRPAEFYGSLRESGDLAEAVRFLGFALPRYEAVLWAAEALKASSVADDEKTAALLTAIEAWIADPEDRGRRAVWSSAEMVDEDRPERLLAYAIFLSGGSIAPEEQEPVNPEPQLCGQLAAAAIIAAAHQTTAPERALVSALAAGEAIARGGD